MVFGGIDMNEKEAATRVISQVPDTTISWLLEADTPAVAALTHRRLLGRSETSEIEKLWDRRNEYEPVRRILELQNEDGSWLPPKRDYKKYEGSLWQIIFLGELYADVEDERIGRADRTCGSDVRSNCAARARPHRYAGPTAGLILQLDF